MNEDNDKDKFYNYIQNDFDEIINILYTIRQNLKITKEKLEAKINGKRRENISEINA